MDNNLVFLGPRILNTQKILHRLSMTLRESVIKKLRLRNQQTTLTKINIIYVDTGGEDSGINKE